MKRGLLEIFLSPQEAVAGLYGVGHGSELYFQVAHKLSSKREQGKGRKEGRKGCIEQMPKQS